MNWYLKYRPRQIQELDLTDVKEQLLQLMSSGRFPHSLLFAGPKGTGKTSSSRIIGAMLNDPINEKAVKSIFFGKDNKKEKLKEPETKNELLDQIFKGQSYVVQEIDAASYRRIDDIRNLKERIFLPPQQGLMTVYILDEVHMLTNEAFNALLKILEEPPAHVIFILATTELHKVPATIVSRCNLVSFHKASIDELVHRLEFVLKAEKIEFEQEALIEIARRADGSFRDAVKLAEIAAQGKKVTLEVVDKQLGGSAIVQVKKLIKLILSKDEKEIVKFFAKLRQQNMNQDYFYESLLTYLHQNLTSALGVGEKNPEVEQKVSNYLLNYFLQASVNINSPISFLPLELATLSLVQKSKQRDGSGGSGNNEKEQASVKQNKQEKKVIKESKEIKNELKSNQEVEVVKEIKQIEYISTDGSLSKHLCDNWQDFLNQVEQQNSTLAALLRSSQPQAGANGTAKIQVYYKFHQEQLAQPKFMQIIEKCSESIVGDKLQFKFVLAEAKPEADLVDVPAHTQELETLAKEALM